MRKKHTNTTIPNLFTSQEQQNSITPSTEQGNNNNKEGYFVSSVPKYRHATSDGLCKILQHHHIGNIDEFRMLIDKAVKDGYIVDIEAYQKVRNIFSDIVSDIKKYKIFHNTYLAIHNQLVVALRLQTLQDSIEDIDLLLNGLYNQSQGYKGQHIKEKIYNCISNIYRYNNYGNIPNILLIVGKDKIQALLGSLCLSYASIYKKPLSEKIVYYNRIFLRAQLEKNIPRIHAYSHNNPKHISEIMPELTKELDMRRIQKKK